MTALVWDAPGDRFYETGLDRGVLYLSDGSGVVWNGLTSLDDKSKAATDPVYFEGVKFDDIYIPGDFEATLKAYTYPDEFLEYEGIREYNQGFLVTGQVPKTFGLSYRTGIGNDLNPELGYKIHILCNLLAVPGSRSFKSHGKMTSAVEFEWALSATPQVVPGFRSSPHLIFDTTKSDVGFISELEAILYGTDSSDPSLPSFETILNMADSYIPS